MQNRYSGDVGDFSKFGLLRQIASTGLDIGLNWYLVDDETHNDDGKHISYLSDRRFNGCDDSLRDALRLVINNNRSVSMLEKQELVKKAVYFSEQLLPPATNGFSRCTWHKNAMERLNATDIVFLDPDNGIIAKSVSAKSGKSIKYVLREEICDYYAAGHSLVIYNHRSRQAEPKYLCRFDWMCDDLHLRSAYRLGLKFMRGTIRDYIFIIQPLHQRLISSAIDRLLDSEWNKQFAKLNFQERIV